MKTALVTGSAGFAGRHFAASLKADGYAVLGIDPRSRGGLVLPDDDALHFFYHNDDRFDVVVHAAAYVGGRVGIDQHAIEQTVNLQLDAAMFRWALRTGPGRVVYLSSPAAYPVAFQHVADRVKLPEALIDPSFTKMIGIPDQMYGWAKLTGENIAYRARQAGLNVTVVRPFSGYGEDQEPAYPFRAFADRALRREEPFTIWGSAVQCRDFIHIDDVVAAVQVMLNEGIDGPVNLGTGRATSMGALARMICNAVGGYHPVLDVDEAAPMGVGYRVADVTLMREFFEPKISLEEGVRRAVRP